MVSHQGQTINTLDIATLVGRAYRRAFTLSNITKGFSATDIYPFNPNVFSDKDFLTSFATDRPDPNTNN